eukprot:403347372
MGNCNNSSKKKKKEHSQSLKIKSNNPSKHSEDSKLEAKIVLIGNSGVGKTSIAMRYKEGKFSDNPKATVGASYFQKNIAFKDGSQMRLHIWDTGGAEKFKTVAPLYYRGAHAAIVCYSVSDDNSFRSVSEWLLQLEDNTDAEKMVKIVVGNKSDVEKQDRRVDYKSGRAYADSRHLEFFETSAILDDESINQVFTKLATLIKQKYSALELTATV